MKEVFCNTCGREFWQASDEVTCPGCQELAKQPPPAPKAPAKAPAASVKK